MNATKSSLIPFNLSNDKLEDDNFVKSNNDVNEQKEFFVEGFEDSKAVITEEDLKSLPKTKSDKEEEENIEKFENNNEESQESIESFSNMNFSCPVTIGGKFCFAYTSASGNTSNCGRYGCRVANLGDTYLTMGHGGKYPQEFMPFYGNNNGNILTYGQPFYFYALNRGTYLHANNEILSSRYTYNHCWRYCKFSYFGCWDWGRRCRTKTAWRGGTIFYMLPAPGSGKKLGDFVNYNDKVIISNSKNINARSYTITSNRRLVLSNTKTAFYIRRPKGYACQVQVPRMIYNGDYKIKKITVRCDDGFSMYLGGKEYVGSKYPNSIWTKTVSWNDVPCNPKGFNIGFRCYNLGGPGSFMACIELYNGSVIFTDETWRAAVAPITNEEFFLNNTNNYYFGRSWIAPNVIGYNQRGLMRWNGKKIDSWNNSHVDSKFSPLAKAIWAGSCTASGVVYFSKTIGEPPRSARCSHSLTFGQALCYMEGNPDVRDYIYTALKSVKYVYNGTYMTWDQHENEAKKQGGNLASITSAEENNYIRDKFLKKSPTDWGFWIGAIRIGNNSYGRDANTWKWSDNSKWNYENFLKNWHEPNNNRENRAHMWKLRVYGSWNDLPGNNRMPGVYKIPDKNKKININDAVRLAQEHWKWYGCTTRENRSYKCAKPPENIGNFGYKGCYNNNFEQKLLPNYRGIVTSLGSCSNLAEKNREMLFGVTNGDQCYTSNNLKEATKNGTATECSTMGKRFAYQLYERKTPYTPLNPKMSEKNFSEKFENFDDKNMKNNKNVYIILLIIILLILYFYFSK